MTKSSRGNLKERLLIFVAVLAFGWLGVSICEDRPVFLSGDGKDRRGFSSVDSWWTPPPNNVNFAPLDRGRFATVKDSLQPEVQAALLEVPAKRVSAEEAARLTGKQLRADEEYILLRGVVLNEGTGGFDVGVSGRAVHIRHDCLGHHAVPMARKALIAVLSALPDEVYISCSMAE